MATEPRPSTIKVPPPRRRWRDRLALRDCIYIGAITAVFVAGLIDSNVDTRREVELNQDTIIALCIAIPAAVGEVLIGRDPTADPARIRQLVEALAGALARRLPIDSPCLEEEVVKQTVAAVVALLPATRQADD